MIDMESNTTLVQCYPAHEAIPDGHGPFPAVIVVHDRFGMSPHVRGVANRLANSGFYALVPSLYAMPTSVADVAPEFMRPSRAVHFGYDDEERAEDAAAMLSQERAEAILGQALAYAIGRAKVRAPAGVGVLGFSMGARLAFLAACRNPEEVRACVAFYGKGIAGSPSLPHGRPAPLDLAGKPPRVAPPLLRRAGYDRLARGSGTRSATGSRAWEKTSAWRSTTTRGKTSSSRRGTVTASTRRRSPGKETSRSSTAASEPGSRPAALARAFPPCHRMRTDPAPSK
jgi:dienelactone hydrolase